MTSKEQQQRLGFEKEGVVKDSHGSAAMSHEGNVESGSPVSRMQAQQPVSPGDLGFGKEGVEKDTPASAMMSHEGNVSASSPVAELQSKGATGNPVGMPKGGARSGGSSRSSRSVNPSSLAFKSGGVVKGSAAAKMMSSQGSVKAGSDIAQLQSHGAKGTPYGLASKPSSRSGGSSGAAKSISPAALGFKPGGVEKGTVAAQMMSTLGSVKSGTIVAQMQSSGAKGTSEGVSCTTHRSSSGQAQYVKCTVKK